MKFLLLLLSLCLTTMIFSQAKSNQIGVFFAPGTYFFKEFGMYKTSRFNIGFAGMYQRGLSDHFTYRASIGGMYETSNTSMENDHYNTMGRKSFFVELIPFQMQYTFNPTNKLQAYIGLNIGVRKTFAVNAVFRKEGEPDFNTTYKNQPFEFFPSVLAGANYRVGEKFSVFLQPEYRPFFIKKTNIGVLHGVNIQVGFLYHF